MLTESGWRDVDIRPLDVECTLPEPELLRYVTRLGPVGLSLQDVDAQTCHEVVEAVRAAFEPFVRGAVVRFKAACWSIGARAPS